MRNFDPRDCRTARKEGHYAHGCKITDSINIIPIEYALLDLTGIDVKASIFVTTTG